MEQDSQVFTFKDLEQPEKGQLTLDDLVARANPNDPKTQKLLKVFKKLSERQDQVACETSKATSSGSSTPKSRGRPKGSKNRNQDEAVKKIKTVKRALSSSDLAGSPKKRTKKEGLAVAPATKVVDLTVNDGANVKEGKQITSFKLTSSLSLEHSPWENNGKWYVGLRRFLANPKKNQSESMFMNLGVTGLRNLEKATKLMMEFLGKNDSPGKPKMVGGESNVSDDDDDDEEDTDTASSSESDVADM